MAGLILGHSSFLAQVGLAFPFGRMQPDEKEPSAIHTAQRLDLRRVLETAQQVDSVWERRRALVWPDVPAFADRGDRIEGHDVAAPGNLAELVAGRHVRVDALVFPRLRERDTQVLGVKL